MSCISWSNSSMQAFDFMRLVLHAHVDLPLPINCPCKITRPGSKAVFFLLLLAAIPSQSCTLLWTSGRGLVTPAELFRHDPSHGRHDFDLRALTAWLTAASWTPPVRTGKAAGTLQVRKISSARMMSMMRRICTSTCALYPTFNGEQRLGPNHFDDQEILSNH